MRFDILTLFPEFFESPLRAGVIGKALERGHVAVKVHDIRDWAEGKHKCADDAPYGGGGGMVMLAEPLLRAIRAVREAIKSEIRNPKFETSSNDPITESETKMEVSETDPPSIPHLIYLSPQGEPLTRELVIELTAYPSLMLLCGSYEGIDERVVELEVDREVSIGDYVLTSGEPAALVLLNAVARRLEGVLGNPASAPNDSFEGGLLDFPHYTRPEVVEGLAVPPVLLSGHHGKVAEWRRQQQLERTARRRPDLLGRMELTEGDRKFLRNRGLG